MRCRHADKRLQNVERDLTATVGHGRDLDTAFRKRLQFIRAARDESDLRRWKSLHFERLKGNRSHQWSIRLKDQWRLILELETDADGKQMVVIEVVDYH
jgi:toxin HigB-1